MYQSIFIRGCFAVIIIGAACIHSGVFKKIPNKSDHKLIFWRTVAEIFATITFLTALFYLPIANITVPSPTTSPNSLSKLFKRHIEPKTTTLTSIAVRIE